MTRTYRQLKKQNASRVYMSKSDIDYILPLLVTKRAQYPTYNVDYKKLTKLIDKLYLTKLRITTNH